MLQLGMLALGVPAFIVRLVLTVMEIRAHFAAKRKIDGQKSRKKVVRELCWLRRLVRAPSIAAPMATVITSTDTEWQTTVKTIAQLCEAVLLDLSAPSENICWELEIQETAKRIIFHTFTLQSVPGDFGRFAFG